MVTTPEVMTTGWSSARRKRILVSVQISHWFFHRLIFTWYSGVGKDQSFRVYFYSISCFSLKFHNSYWFLPPDDAEVARVEHGSQSEDATHGSQSEDATGGIDLNCKEHVSDTETDSQSEDEALIENKRFPQQRFSPVQKHVSGSDITHRPKPIKMKPESPIRAELIRQVSVCSLYLLRLKRKRKVIVLTWTIFNESWLAKSLFFGFRRPTTKAS